MDDEVINEIISKFPGTKRSAQGVVFPTGDGGLFHLTALHDSEALEGLSSDETFYLAFCAKKEILRLRELRNSHDYLLRLRASSIVDSPRLVRVMAARKKEFQKAGRLWSLTHYYHSRDHYHKYYIDQLQKENAKIAKKTPSGLVFSAEVNAMCMRSFVGDVVIASESLEYFYYFMTIAFYGGALGIKPIDRADALIIAVRLLLGSEALDFDLDPRGSLSVDVERRVVEMVANQMKFTFGHEYAHLLCGHLTEPDMLIKLNTFNDGVDNEQKIKVYNHDLEFQADIFSLKNVEHNYDAFVAVAHGAFSVLIYLHFIDLISEICDLPKFAVSLTHPTPKQRIESLHKNLGRKSPYGSQHLLDAFATSEKMVRLFKKRVASADREDILGFYGSIYLPSFTHKIKRDRYDF